MVGKHLLPWFGGSSSVWATSLLFFTGMLFFGYAYVYLLTHYGGKRQALIHTLVIISLSLASIFALRASLEWTIGDQGTPALNVLLALLAMIGAPYFLLSTTGPLLQYWWGLASEREPYKLYALSNAGSLLALIGYVLVIEPNVTLPDSETVWLLAFMVYAALACIVSVGAARRKLSFAHTDSTERISWKRALSYVALAGLPSFVLVAGTTSITQTIAPVPLLWVVPLMLYLLTLIIAFEGWGQKWVFAPLFALLAAYAVYSYLGTGAYYMARAVGANFAFIFMAGFLCHTWLYRLRPHIAKLPLFYLYISFGGMLGVFAASLVAPMVFTEFVEFPLAVAIVAALAGIALPLEAFPRALDVSKVRLVKVAFAVVCAGLFFNYFFLDNGVPYIVSRNFYGSAKIRFDATMYSLMHGTTLHGFQMRDRELEFSPHGYYVPQSGIGRAIRYAQTLRDDAGVSIGILGLGTGGLSAYCRNPSTASGQASRPGSGQAGDTYVFYEIDPRMLGIAQTYFSYLRHCKGSQVHLGDGRLVLEQERKDGSLGGYDVLAMDAFTDDTVPVHLITREAIALYAAHLRSPQGIIAIHTSNRYLDLPPMVLKTAASLGFTGKVIEDDGSESPIGSTSQWVLLAKDPAVFKDKVFEGAADFFVPNMAKVPLWTDSYASMTHVLRLTLFN